MRTLFKRKMLLLLLTTLIVGSSFVIAKNTVKQQTSIINSYTQAKFKKEHSVTPKDDIKKQTVKKTSTNKQNSKSSSNPSSNPSNNPSNTGGYTYSETPIARGTWTLQVHPRAGKTWYFTGTNSKNGHFVDWGWKIKPSTGKSSFFYSYFYGNNSSSYVTPVNHLPSNFWTTGDETTPGHSALATSAGPGGLVGGGWHSSLSARNFNKINDMVKVLEKKEIDKFIAEVNKVGYFKNVNRFKNWAKNMNLKIKFSSDKTGSNLSDKIVAQSKYLLLLPRNSDFIFEKNTINYIDVSNDAQNIGIIDISTINNLPPVVFTGSTNKLEWSEPANSKVEHLFQVGTGPFMTLSELKNRYDGTDSAPNFWNSGTETQSGSWANSIIHTKIIPGPLTTIVDANKKIVHEIPQPDLDVSTMSLDKYVNNSSIASFLTEVKGAYGLKVQGSAASFSWANKQVLETYANNLGINITFLLTNNGNKPASSNSNWSNIPPTDLSAASDENSRHLWMKINSKNDFILSAKNQNSIIDITNESKIKTLILVDTSSIDLSTIRLVGTTKSFTISGEPTTPNMSIKYSADGSTWLTKANFINFVQSHPLDNEMSNFKAKLFSSTDLISDKKITVLDTSNLYYYRDISSIITNFKRSDSVVSVTGQFDVTNGAFASINPKFEYDELQKIGIKLQLFSDGAWTDVPKRKTWTLQNKILGFHFTTSGAFKFRFVPIRKLNASVSNPDNANYLKWVDASKTKLSDFVAANEVVNNIVIDKSAMLSSFNILKTSSSELAGISLRGSTHDLTISSFDIAAVLEKTNPGQGSKIAAYIKPTFSINGGTGMWFERSDFIAWLNGSLTIAGGKVMNGSKEVKVWIGNSLSLMPLPTSKVKPAWNDLQTANISVRWNSKDTSKSVSDHNIQALTSTNVKKWVDLTPWLKRLKMLVITGNTNSLTSAEFNAIKSELATKFGANIFKIVTSPIKKTDGTFDFAQTAKNGVDALPTKINFDKDLAFKISLGTGANAANFIASKLDDPTKTEVIQEWTDANQKTKVKKFVDVDKNDLATGVALSGDTKNLVVTISSETTHSDNWGVMSASSSIEGVKVYFKLDVSTSNNSFMPKQVFLEYLSGRLVKNGSNINDSHGNDVSKYGFTVQNYKPVFDGSWGTDAIKVKYMTKSGFVIDANQASEVALSDASRTNVKRYLDISNLITEAKKIKVRGDNTLGWWNPSTGNYDKSTTWKGYIDNKKLLWDIPSAATTYGDLHVKIQYSKDNKTWGDNLPTSVDNAKSNRHIYFKYIWDNNKYGIEAGVVLSDDSGIEITANSKVRDVLTYVDINAAKLDKVSIEGFTNKIISVDISNAAIPTNAHLEISITGFKDADWKNPNDPLVQKLTSMTGISSLADLQFKYKTSMTVTEFKAWIAQLATAKSKALIKRSWISLRLVSNVGFSIREAEDKATRITSETTSAIIDKLFTYKDVSAIRTKISTNNGVSFSGSLGITDGVEVNIVDDSLTPVELAKLGLKMQFATIADQWHDVTGLKVSTPDVAAGKLGGQNTFLITVAKAPAGQDPFLKFRLVPIKDEDGNAVTNSANGDYLKWVKATHVKLSDYSKHDQLSDTEIDRGSSLASLPIITETKASDLSSITLGGNTHDLTIGAFDTAAALKKANQGSKFNFSNVIKPTFSAIGGNGLWFEKADFLAWLSGSLTWTGGKAMNGSKEVKVWVKNGSTRVPLTKANLKPVWNDLDTANISARWNSIDSNYHVSDQGIQALASASNVKKWTDLTPWLNRLRDLIITGNTNALASTEFDTIKSELATKFGANIFKIVTSPIKKTDGTFDFAQTTKNGVDALPAKINFDKDLAFKITAGTGANASHFIASKSSDPTKTEVIQEWTNTAQKAKIGKYINVAKADLADGFTLGGNTKKLLVNVKPATTHSDKFGDMSATGTIVGVEIYFKLKSTSLSFIPKELFFEYLSDKLVKNGSTINDSHGNDVSKYGFTVQNYKPVFDGSWGTEDFQVKYHAKPGFAISASEAGASSFSDAERANVKRYLDISNLITEAKKIKVKGDNSLGWWNPSTGDYDKSTTWKGYVDNHKLLWDVPSAATTYGDLHVKIQYSVDKKVWTDTLPTSIADTKADRHIYFKYVWNNTKYGVEAGVVLSDDSVFDITTTSNVKHVLTYVDINGANLDKVSIEGLTNNVTSIDVSNAAIPTHSHLEISITGFKDADWKNPNDPLVQRLTSMTGISSLNDLQQSKYKTSMTIAEFKAWITQLAAGKAGALIKRSWISLRLVSDIGFSIRETEDKAKRVNSKTTAAIIKKLFQYKDVDSLRTLMQKKVGIKLSGRISVTDGVEVSINDKLTKAELAKLGLKMQFSKVSGTWEDVPTLATTQKDQNAGKLGGAHTFSTTIQPGANNVHPFIKFRLVPIKDEDGNDATNPDNGDYLKWVEATHVKLSDFVKGGSILSAVEVDKGTDAATLPTLVKTQASDLNSITLGGSTHAITVGAFDSSAKLKALNSKTKKNFDTIIKPTFSAIGGKGLWFEKDDFIDWMNGTLTWTGNQAMNPKTHKAVKVWIGDDPDNKPLPQKDLKPVWNDLDTANISARWNSNDSLFTPVDHSIQQLSSASNVKKWVDLTTWLNRLKTLVITGNTNALASTEFDTIKSELATKFGTNVFKITTSPIKKTDGTFDFAQTTKNGVDTLPTEINFDKDLAFKITLGTSSEAAHFIASRASDITKTEVIQEWTNTAQKAKILNFVHVSKIDLQTKVILGGNTKALTITKKPIAFNHDKFGVMSATGSLTGVEIFLSLNNVTGANLQKMPEAVFKAYLNGTLTKSGSRILAPGIGNVVKYGFNATNFKLNHDGSWGTENIRVYYHALQGYVISPANEDAITFSDASRTNVKRYLDISNLITEAKKIKVKGDNSLGWWNPSTGDYDKSTTWKGYVDNHKLLWDVPSAATTYGDLHVKIQYSVDKKVWTDTLPTSIADTKADRHIYFKYVWNNTKYGVEAGVVLSDDSVFDITASSNIQHVLTYVDINGAKLDKVSIEGLTNNVTSISVSNAAIPTNTHLEISITGFKDADWKNPNDPLVQRLTSMTGISSLADLQSKYKTSMTIAEFKAWITQLATTRSKAFIKRSWISLRLVSDAGFSLRESEDKAKRIQAANTGSVIEKLFQYKVVDTLKVLMAKKVGISLSGRISVADGVEVSINDKLTKAELAKLGLKMQFSKVSGTWEDVPTLVASQKDTASGKLGGAHTFSTTISKAPAGKSPFIKFRLVPIKDEDGNAVTNSANGDYLKWVKATHVKLSDFVKGHEALSATEVDKGALAAKLPILVKTQASDLNSITVAGSTRAITVGAFDAAAKLKALNTGSTFDFSTIMKPTFSAIGGNGLWFEKVDFIEWMKGTLTWTGGKAMNPTTHKEVKVWDGNAPDQSPLAQAKLKPIWNDLDTANISARWNSTNQQYRAIDHNIQALPSASNVKKWVDLTIWLDRLKDLVITGQTNSLASAQFNAIKQEIAHKFGQNIFKITASPIKKADGTFDFAQTTKNGVDALPAEINFDKDLAFKITQGTGSNAAKFIPSKEADITKTEVIQEWTNTTQKAKILNFIHASHSDLADDVVLSGTTKLLVATIASEATKQTKFGVMDQAGSEEGLEVWFSLTNVTGANSQPMPKNIFLEYLKGALTKSGSKVLSSSGTDVAKYGFTTSNFKLSHDGSWGTPNIKVQYHVKTGFVISNAEKASTSLSVNSIKQVDRFLDLTDKIAKAKRISIKGDKSQGWWNPSSGKYDDIKTRGYVDNKHLLWNVNSIVTNYGDLKVKIQYSVDKKKWVDNLPASVVDTKTQRNIYFKYVLDGTKYGDEHGIVLSDSAVYDITLFTHIRDILTYVDIKTADLTKTSIEGLTDNISSIDISKTKLPAHTHIEFSITGFKDLDFTKLGDLNIIKLKALTGISSLVDLQSTYKTSMTRAEFIKWIAALAISKPHAKIKRSWISLRVVADTGFSFTSLEDSNKRIDSKTTTSIIEKLFTPKDVSSIKTLMKKTTGISLSGRIGSADGVEISFDPKLTKAELAKLGLKMQFSKVSGTWEDVPTLATTQKDQNAGKLGGAHTFSTTISKAPAGKSPFIKFRLVPIKDEDGNAVTNSANGDYLKWVKATHVKLSDFVKGHEALSATEVDKGALAAKLPILVKTQASDLNSITVAGSTRAITVGAFDAAAKLKALNTGSTFDFSTIMKSTFSAIGGKGLWFEKADFIEWMKGTLTWTGGKAMNHTTNTEVQVWVGDSPTTTALSKSKLKPIWNDLDTANISARWNSIDPLYRPVDHNIQALASASKVKKWVDLTPWLNRLKNLVITGETNNLASSSFNKIKNEFVTKFGQGVFQIVTSPIKKTDGTFDFAQTTKNGVDTLPAEINFDKDLAFKIKTGTGTKAANFIASKEADVTKTEVIQEWTNATQKKLIKNFVHVDKSIIPNQVVLSGNTKDLVVTFKPEYLKQDKFGVMSATGSHEGVEIWFSLPNVTGVNNVAMPQSVFLAYISGKLVITSSVVTLPDKVTNVSQFGFTSSNYKVSHDGSWGTDDIYVEYHAKAGYVISSLERTPQTLSTNSRKQVDRYIDVTPFVNAAKKTKVKGDTTHGWWNPQTGQYDKSTVWKGYVDNKKLLWAVDSATTNYSQAHIKIQYSVDKKKWTDDLPTSVVDTKNQRHIFFKYIWDNVKYGVEHGVVLSDTAAHDITAKTGIQSVLTYIDIKAANLTNVSIKGLTNKIASIDISHAAIPANTELQISVTGFIDVDWVNTSDPAVMKFKAMNIKNAADLQTSFKSSMTISQFIKWINDFRTANPNVQIKRSWISLRLVAHTGFSIRQTEDSSKRVEAGTTTSIIDELFSYKDVTKLKEQMSFDNSNLATRIGLFGQQSTTDGVVVSVPTKLTEAELAKLGLKMQFTLDTADGIHPLAGGKWNDIITIPIKANTKVGQSSAVPHGFIVTITPKKGGKSYLGFRLVPIKDDMGVGITQDVNSNHETTKTYEWYGKQMHFKLFYVKANKTIELESAIRIDTSKIPVVIKTAANDLDAIAISGDTRHATIFEDVDGFGSKTNTINETVNTHNTDAFLSTKLVVKYTIDYIDGAQTKLNTKGAIDKTKKLMWLNKDDFTAYLNGNLVVVGSKIVYKNKKTQEIKLNISATENLKDMAAWIKARGLKSNDEVSPIYNNLDIHSIFMKWTSLDAKYIPSDIAEEKLDIKGNPQAKRFRKWIDGSKFIAELKTLVAKGSTKSNSDYNIDLPAKLKLVKPSVLAALGLKLQYSPDKKKWADTKFDFQSLTYKQQKDRVIYMRIAPLNYNGQGSITTTQTDVLVIDYGPSKKSNAQIITDSVVKKVREFKFWINVNASELTKLKIEGTSTKLGAQNDGLKDTVIDTDVDRYKDVIIKYKFDGNWYTKKELLSQLDQLRKRFENHVVGTPWPSIPSDFNHSTVKAKWFVTNTDDTVIKQGQDVETEVDKTSFKTWVNIWDIQKSAIQKYVDGKIKVPFSDLVGGDGTDYDLSGTINSVAMSRKAALLEANLVSHKVKVQWTTQQNPGFNRASADWHDAINLKQIVAAQMLNPKHKSLYIRFITTNVNFVASTQGQTDWGNSDNILPIRIDVSKLKYEVGVHSSDLEGIIVNGDTQSGFNSTSNTIFLSGTFKAEDSAKTSGIRYKTVDATGRETIVPAKDRASWIQDVGLTIEFKVVATRTKGKYIIGKTYTFNTYKDFKDALADSKHELNFLRSSLKVRWGTLTAKAAGFQVSDANWVTPSDVTKLINVIYSKDTTTITNNSWNLFHNTLSLKVGIKNAAFNNLPHGLKIQWTTDADVKTNKMVKNPVWHDGKPTTLPEHKLIWIKFTVTDVNKWKLGADTGDANIAQITKINTSHVKIAIALDSAWMKKMKNSSVNGKTYHINWNHPLAIVPQSDDGIAHGHIEFSVDGITWHRQILKTANMAAAITAAINDYYGKGIAAFDKDKHVLSFRYVLNTADAHSYIFTDDHGDESDRGAKDLEKEVDTKKLVQPIINDTADNNLPLNDQGQKASWLDFVKSGKFKPSFATGTVAKTATLTTFKWDGNDVDKNGHSFYKLDVNKFNKADILSRDIWNALAPRHAHFEFKVINVDPKKNPNAWTSVSWSSNPPTNVATSTNYKGLKVRLVADDDYEIPDGKTVGVAFGNQTFESDYNIIIEINVDGIKVTSAKFIGIDDGTGASRVSFITDDPNGDYSKGNPIINVYDKNNKALKATDWKAFVLEYRVTRKGKDVPWTDSNNNTKPGWHAFVVAPDDTLPWYGYTPTSLKNNDVVEYRLRARDGYLLLDSDKKVPKDKMGYARISHVLGHSIVTGIKKAIIIPKDTNIFDINSLIDFNGNPITDNLNMPSVKFFGNEGKGGLSFDLRSFKIKSMVEIEVQVLHPIKIGIADSTDSFQKPRNGYFVKTKSGTEKVLEKIHGKWVWKINSEFIKDSWQKPSAVHDLSVGDAIRVRFAAKKGFAFMWENPLTKFIDIAFPKKFSRAVFGINTPIFDSAVASSKGQFAAIPVRGLSVLPPITPQSEKLILSKKLSERLVKDNAVFTMSTMPSHGDKWKWDFTIIKKSGRRIPAGASIPTTNLDNGDKIEVTVKPITTAFKLDDTYAKALKKRIFVISGLKVKIDVIDVPRPEVIFDGRVGHGVIKTLKETNSHKVQFNRTGTTLPKPVLGSNAVYKGKGVKWQFQKTSTSPLSMSESELNGIPWTDKPPIRLNNGDFIRVRLVPIDPNDVALLTKPGTLHEQIILMSHDTIVKNGVSIPEPYGPGWVKVHGLVLNPENISITHSITGFKGKSHLSASTLGKTLSDKGVIIEASYDGGKTWHDPSWFHSIDNTIFDSKGNPTNNTLRFRVYPKNGYEFNKKDDDPAKGIKIYEVNGIKYLERKEWKDIEVKGLKSYLNVSRLVIEQPIMIGKLDGNGSFRMPKILGLDSVVDKNNSKLDSRGRKYKDFIKLKYIVRKLDPDTGDPLPEFTIFDPTKPPTGLFNGDTIKIQVYVDEDNDPTTESEYRLSTNVSISITIKGLITKIPQINDPSISFIGKSGEGSAIVSPNAPRRTMWQFAVVKKKSTKFTTPDPKSIVWLPKSPTNLSIGDYVMVRLVDLKGKEVLQDKVIKDPATGSSKTVTEKVYSKWIMVSGLKETIDLSKLIITAIDSRNPNKPDASISDRVAFKLDGKQSGFSKVSLNKNLKELLTSNGQKIPFAEALIWEFAIIEDGDTKGKNYDEQQLNWSTSMPKNLENGNKIFARLIVKGDMKYKNYKVYGFRALQFDVQNLTDTSKISSKSGMIILAVVGIISTTGLGGALIMLVRMRRRFKI